MLPVRDRGPAQFDLFDVNITNVPENARTKVMAQLRSTFPMSLAEARTSVDALPFKLGTGLREGSIEDLRCKFADAGASVEVRRVGGEENPAFGPIQDYRLFVVRATAGEVEVRSWSVGNEVPIEDLTCGDCGTKGTLVDDADALPPACPRCSGTLSKDGGYVT